VDTNPQTAQISIAAKLCNNKIFSHETMINVLVVQEFLKAGEEGQEAEKDLTKKEGQDF
jgi:hypothetical protein